MANPDVEGWLNVPGEEFRGGGKVRRWGKDPGGGTLSQYDGPSDWATDYSAVDK